MEQEIGGTTNGRKSRRDVLKLGIGALGVSALGGYGAPVRAAEFTYKYANNLPATHPMNLRAKEYADRIEKETSGRVVFRIFPSNQLGSDTEMLSQVRSGGIEFFTLSGLILATLVPAASINGIGFAFTDYDAVWKAMDGDLGKYVRGEIGRAGLVAMDRIWDNGFRQITTSGKPIANPADLKGLKIRVPVSPLWTSMFKAFDASPTSINFAETYSALQTRHRRRPGEPARGDLDGQALRGAEVLLADQPHVGRLLDAREQGRVGPPAARPANHRRIVQLERCGDGRAGRHGEAQREPAGRSREARARVQTSRTPRSSATRCAAPASTRSGRRSTAPTRGRCWSRPRGR